MYQPLSLLLAFMMDKSPSFEIALDCGSTPFLLDQVIAAGGTLFTRHFGRVTLPPIATNDGPGRRVTVGLTARKQKKKQSLKEAEEIKNTQEKWT